MKALFYLIVAGVSIVTSSCGKSSPAPNPTPTITIPVVSGTTAITGVTGTGAISGGNITSDGGTAITARGVCWSTFSNPTTANNKTVDGSGTGVFSSNLTGLVPAVTYYVRAYATNSVGTTYGNELNFTTSGLVVIPTLTTISATTITSTTAVSGGNISADGGGTITARGICWSTSTNPVVSGNRTTDGTGTGAFSSNMTALNPYTIYYVRAYATNSAGTAYGNEINFNTPLAGTLNICSQAWMDRNLDVATYRNGDPIPHVTNNTTWASLTTGAYCYYNNDSATYAAIYGKLYNWYAITDPRILAPTGWHIPSSAEWAELTTCLGGNGSAGGKLKETGTLHWSSPNTGATNSSGFTAVPGGNRSSTGTFGLIGTKSFWWTSTQTNAFDAGIIEVLHDNTYTNQITASIKNGQSVRCIKN